MRIMALGCTGFLGTALVEALAKAGHSLTLVTHVSRPPEAPGIRLLSSNSPWENELYGMDAIVNLAGASLSEGRWNAARRETLRSSRLHTTQRIAQALAQGCDHPLVWPYASAVGYYGECGEEPLTEHEPAGEGFLASLCEEWERAASLDPGLGVRCVQLRTGLVLGSEGFLPSVLPWFKMGLGGPWGGGAHYVPWIHLRDWVNAVLFLLERPLQGPVNLVAPGAVTQAAFARFLGQALHRPAFLPVPAWFWRLALGEQASLLLEGQRVVPEELRRHGFRFAYADLESAFKDLLS